MAGNGKLADHSGQASRDIKTRGLRLFFEFHSLFPISVDFIYKTSYAPTKTKTDVTPAFILLSRIF
jgi:hypothetical protein